jgi:hypothetical protein
LYELEQKRLDMKEDYNQLTETLKACQAHYAVLKQIQIKFTTVRKRVEDILTNTCETYCQYWKQNNVRDSSTACINIVLFNQSLPARLQKVQTEIEDIASHTHEIEMQTEFSWEGPSFGVVSRTSPSLDAHIQKLANLQMCMESNHTMRSCLDTFLTTFFGDASCSIQSYKFETLWHTSSCNMLKTHLAELRHRIALAEAVMVG